MGNPLDWLGEKINGTSPPPYEPLNPDTWSPEERVNFLSRQGFDYIGGAGPTASWAGPDGKTYLEQTAFETLLGWISANGAYHAGQAIAPSKTSSAPPSTKFDAQGRAFAWVGPGVNDYEPTPQWDDYTKAAGYRAPSNAQPQQAPNGTYQKSPNGDVWYYPAYGGEPRFLNNIGADAVNLEAFTGANGHLWTRNPQTGEQKDTGTQVAFSQEDLRGQQLADQQSQQNFTSEDNALSRALTAGQYAAGVALKNQQLKQQAQDSYETALNNYRQTQLKAASDLATQVSATNPGALSAFYYGGGDTNIGNALANGGTAVNDTTNLPAARTLQTIQNSRPPVYNDPTPIAFDASQFTNPAAPANSAQARADAMAAAWNASHQSPAASNAFTPYAGQTQNPAGGGNWTGSQPPATTTAAQANESLSAAGVPDWVPRFAFGTDQPPMADGSLPVGQSTSFISGDAQAADPMAGGANPEGVQINDPTGDATFKVDPLTQPGQGDKSQQIGNLFSAIADFIKGGASDMPMGGLPEMRGGMPRFAFGTDSPAYPGADLTIPPPTEADRPFLDQIASLRANVKYPQLNPYSTKFGFQPQSMQGAFYAGRQEQFGIPVADQQQQQQQFALHGTNGRSPFTQGL